MKRCHRIGASIGRAKRPDQPRTTPQGMTTTAWKRQRREKDRG